MNIETKMRAERRRREWDQQTLSSITGVTRADISRIENGRLRPYRRQALRLAAVLGLNPSELQEPAITQEPITA
jgi:transcriptional regulator with XRE-family HTH domain